jgi:DNA topoisomerase-1
LRELQWESEAEAKRHVVEMVKSVSKQLGNTPAVCRKCYIHPAVVERFLLGALAELPRREGAQGPARRGSGAGDVSRANDDAS